MDEIKWLQKQKHFEWMQKCLVCWKVCEEFIMWGLDNGKQINSLNACRDVTEICSQCIKFDAQRSPFFKQLCDVAADFCEKFVFDLGKVENKNKTIIDTVSSCKTFVEACRKVSQTKDNSLNINDELVRKPGDQI